MLKTRILLLIFCTVLSGCGGPPANVPFPSMHDGDFAALLVQPPYGRPVYEVNVSLEAGTQGYLQGKGLVPTYDFLIESPRYDEYSYELSEPQSIRRKMALETFQTLGDQAAIVTNQERMVWATTTDQTYGLGHGDIFLTLGLIPHHLGFSNSEAQFGLYKVRQEVQTNPIRVHLEWFRNETTLIEADMTFGAAFFPQFMSVKPTTQFVPAGAPVGATWTVTAREMKLGSGATIAVAGHPMVPSSSPILSPLDIVEGSVPGSSLAIPRFGSALPEVQFAEALAAALKAPQQVQWTVDKPRQVLCGYMWERDRFILVNGDGQSADPSGTSSHRHQFGFAMLPLTPGFVQANGILVQEHNVAGRPVVPPVGFMPTGGNALCSAYSELGGELNIEAMLPDTAIAVFEDFASPTTIDVLRWDIGVIGESAASFWILQSGCHIEDQGLPTTLVVQAWSGEVQYYFQWQGPAGLNACSLGTYPPVR